MRLNILLKGIAHEVLDDASAVEVSKITCDSREVEPGELFVAIRGTVTDGHTFIPQAIEKGAVAILCEETPEELPEGVTFIRVEHTDMVLGELAANFYDHPSEKLKLVGVTGTNGKTTIATLSQRLFSEMGFRTGLISTVCVIIGEKEYPSKLTTPDALSLQRYLHEMVEAGCEYAFMEVSSHALHQHRVKGTRFAGAVFTNLTRDHLDYHGTFLNYLHAKQSFFDGLPEDAFALTNIDDSNGAVMVQNSKADIYSYALKRDADFKGKILEQHLDGTDLILNGTQVSTRLVGSFNAYNLLAIAGAAILLGAPKEEVLRGISLLTPVAGRFQTISSPTKGYIAVIDYAHTPDAIENVLSTLRELQKTHGGKIITVVGAGGNRDHGKRPIMAASAAKGSDQLILTSDNPRFESPELIIKEMEEGLDRDAKKRTLSITSRREAIKTACTLAQQNDIILIAGKGHEDYQEVEGVRHHFNDLEEVTNIIRTEE